MARRAPSHPATRARMSLERAPARVITLYGSGRPTPDGARFAEELGRGIAARGWVIQNGGYGGTMEAAARGARQAGGTVVGVTCRAFGRDGPNRWISRARETEDLFGRLAALVEGSDAFGAFVGGTGTLTEVFLTWELMAKGLLQPRPLCLLGPGWSPWCDLFAGEPALRERLPLLSRADDVEGALERLGASAPPSEAAGEPPPAE